MIHRGGLDAGMPVLCFEPMNKASATPIAEAARLDWRGEPGLLTAQGSWDAHGCGPLARRLAADFPSSGHWRLDTTAIGRMDTAGAFLLLHLIERLRAAGAEIDLSGLPERHRELLELVQRPGDLRPPAPETPLNPLERTGQLAIAVLTHSYDTLVFTGEIARHAAPLLLRPWRLRWATVINEVHAAGVLAIPIVALLSFLIGVVIAYQAGATLDRFGANIFLADMVGVVTLREMAPMITAIVIAGRTGSSYAARIGTMRVTQEVDALRALALPPLEMLVIPRILALMIALPLLTVLADAAGLFGGLLISHAMFGLDLNVAFERLELLKNTHVWVGLIKTPVFAAIIALIGCHEGMKVRGSTAEVGQATTSSVVQAIFWVIVVDAVFSIVFRELNL
ncbi:MAG: MlaE family lipid ABC transporter permease subunit [Halothiobacillaceae bacterium]|nr:MAG: MlaE family lipid ABC transporter permease subunit [Halothiobacillaceae bacterium]